MNSIQHIYINSWGTSFYWKKENNLLLDRVQLVFRETGFYLTKEELHHFNYCIQESFMLNKGCNECELKNKCHRFLLKTPCSQIDLAVSMQELHAVKDLVEGTLFKMNLNDYLEGEGRN